MEHDKPVPGELDRLKHQLEAKLDSVDGWLYCGEAWALHELARTVSARSEEVVVVEIGSYKGRSTIALATGLHSRGRGKVHAIDPHIGGDSEHLRQYGAEDTYVTFIRNIANAGLVDIVHPMRMTSTQARSSIAPRSVDVLFVDGSHEYQDVKADIEMYVPTLRDDAALAFNDPSHPGVYRALRESILAPSSPFRHPRLIQNTLFLDFRRTAAWTPADAKALRRLKAVLAFRSHAARVRPYMPTWLVRVGHAASRALVGSG